MVALYNVYDAYVHIGVALCWKVVVGKSKERAYQQLGNRRSTKGRTVKTMKLMKEVKAENGKEEFFTQTGGCLT